MTDADEPAVRRVTTDGITVEKSLAEDRFPVPAVQFQIASDVDREVELRVTDEIPDAVPMDHIGFHPDFESDNWTAFSDHRVRYERVLDPGEELETVYGIRDDESFDHDAFLTDPSVATTDPEQGAVGIDGTNVQELLGDGIPEDADGLVREMFAGEDGGIDGDLNPEMDTNGHDPFGEDSTGNDDAIDPEPDSIGTEDESSADMNIEMNDVGDIADPRDEGGTPFEDEEMPEAPSDDALFRDAQPADDDPLDDSSGLETEEETPEHSTSEPTTEPGRPSSDDVAAALLADLRSGAVDDEVRDALRDELIGGEVPPSMEVRLRHVQSRVEDLSAYTDALESFIDEQGTASVIQELDTEIDSIAESVATLESELEGERRERAEVTDRLEDIESQVTGIAAVDEDLSEVRSQLDAFESRLGSMEGEVDETAEDLGAIRSEVRALSEDVAEVSERMDEFEAVAASVEDLKDEVEEIEGDIDSLESWQDTVSDAFGG